MAEGLTACEEQGHEQIAAHPCPFLADVEEDSATLCTCCEDCQEDCADEV